MAVIQIAKKLATLFNTQPAILSTQDQVNVRQNIAAAPIDVLAYSGMQVNGNFEVAQEFGGTFRSVNTGASVFNLCDVFGVIGTSQHVLTAYQGGAFGSIAWKNCLQISAGTGSGTVLAADTMVILQRIEGARMSRVFFGSAQGQPITVAFWVYASIPGNSSVSINNNAGNRFCVQPFTIIAGGTWEYKVVTFPPDTTGTWLRDNGRGALIYISMGVGSTYSCPTLSLGVWGTTAYYGAQGNTNFFATTGNSFMVGGFMVLPGNQAPAADRSFAIQRPYGDELQLVKRYYDQSWASNPDEPGAAAMAVASSATRLVGAGLFAVPKRIAPTFTIHSPGNGVDGSMWIPGVSNPAVTAAIGVTAHSFGPLYDCSGAAMTAGQVGVFNWKADARL